MALEETIGEMEDEKKSGIEESIVEEEIKIQDSQIECDIVEQSTAEREDIMFTEEQKIPEIEEVEGPLNLENIENQQDEKMEDVKVENTNSDKLNVEELENIDIHLRTDEEKSQSEVIESNSFENIKIKEEPLDEIEEQIEEQFDFTNVDIKKEPAEPEPGTYYLITSKGLPIRLPEKRNNLNLYVDCTWWFLKMVPYLKTLVFLIKFVFIILLIL